MDILSADPKYDLYENLRQEALSILQTPKDWEDPVRIRKLVLLDSTIRESLRTNPTLVRGLLRGAVHKNGLDLPDGNHIPSGSWIGSPVLNIHYDDRFYDDATEFNPWRFVDTEGREEGGSEKRGAADRANVGPNGKLKIESGQANDTFLSFGGGKHAWYVFCLVLLLLRPPHSHPFSYMVWYHVLIKIAALVAGMWSICSRFCSLTSL